MMTHFFKVLSRSGLFERLIRSISWPTFGFGWVSLCWLYISVPFLWRGAMAFGIRFMTRSFGDRLLTWRHRPLDPSRCDQHGCDFWNAVIASFDEHACLDALPRWMQRQIVPATE